jgi:endonuclease/exonuclease/phosphatase family metal-dependent hydrolase
MLLTAATLAWAAPPASSSEPRPARVMTRNLYLGADLTPALLAEDPLQAALAAAQIWGTVQATNFPERAASLAFEIYEADPDVVGLQEVALWRIGRPLDPNPADFVVYDFLASLQSELAALGLDYTPAVIQKEADIEATALFDPTIPLALDIRLTQRDVILVRADAPAEVTWSNPQSGNFDAILVIPDTPLGDIPVERGWTSLDLVVNKRPFRFINTHLEAFDPFQGGLRVAQTFELLAGPAATDMKVVLVGDLNSGPHDLLFFDSWDFLTALPPLGAGFVDAWEIANPDDPGFTCCQAEDLLNPASLHDERIDHILTRPEVDVNKVKIVGNDVDNRTPSGLWPSDHSGMVAALTP